MFGTFTPELIAILFGDLALATLAAVITYFGDIRDDSEQD